MIINDDRLVLVLKMSEIKPGMMVVFKVAPGEDFEEIMTGLEEWSLRHNVEILVMGDNVDLLGVDTDGAE